MDRPTKYGGVTIQKSFTFPEVDDYIANEFQIENYDYFLYAVAN